MVKVTEEVTTKMTEEVSTKMTEEVIAKRKNKRKPGEGIPHKKKKLIILGTGYCFLKLFHNYIGNNYIG
jgi:hypothetical protein